MAQPVTIFRWDDAGAPQLVNRKPSEIIDILTKCLVDGYGSKLPLGWTRPFYDAVSRTAFFRNDIFNGGSGGHLKVWDASGTDANGGSVRTLSALSVIDINTPVRPGYFQTTAAGVNQLQWALIGTATAFYFFVEKTAALMSGNTVGTVSMFAGDIFSFVPNDQGRFVAMSSIGGGDNSSNAGWPACLDALNYSNIGSTAAMFKMWDTDGAENTRNYRLAQPLSPMASSVSSASTDGAPALPQILANLFLQLAGQTVTTPGVDRFGQDQLNSLVSPFNRGLMPGLFAMANPGYRLQTWPVTFSVGNDQFYLLPHPLNAAPMMCIKLGEWNDPFN